MTSDKPEPTVNAYGAFTLHWVRSIVNSLFACFPPNQFRSVLDYKYGHRSNFPIQDTGNSAPLPA